MLELALALLILGLLIAVTVASMYDHQFHKSKRQVVHRLQEVSDWLHLQKASQGSFASILPAEWSTGTADMSYTITLARTPVLASDPRGTFPALGQETFTLQAVPQKPDDCGTLLLDQAGRRGITGQKASVKDCWE
jgi:Tfp pilus assembly protein PilE